MKDYRDRALQVIAIMTHFNAMDGNIKKCNDEIFIIAHSFHCTDTCKKRARDRIAMWIRFFRKVEYDFYYTKKESE